MQNSKIFPETIPRNPVLGERKVCFRSPKVYQDSLTVTAIKNSKNFPGDKTPEFCFRGGKFVFVLRKCILKLSYGKAEFKNFLGDKTPDLCSRGGEKSLFLFSKNVLKLFYSNAEFKNFPGTKPRTFVLGEESLFSFSENVY